MDISALRDRNPERQVLSVGQLNENIKAIIENNAFLKYVTVKGEISNFTHHSSGHLYFTLKDEEGQIRAVMFRPAAMALRFIPEDGMKVVVFASVSVYIKSGQYQLYVKDLQPDGVGALYQAFEQLKNKLSLEGLFAEEHKKTIPRMPMKIGVITSPTGAAVHDIMDITGRRFPLATVYLYPSLVQGDAAEESLIRGLSFFEESHLCDVIIIGRGGGSIEDLWAFNGERLARKIYDMQTPVISAVGHETDFTICDFVADLRAPTPSAAAELSVPDVREISMWLDTVSDRLCELLLSATERKQKDFRLLAERLRMQKEAIFSDMQSRLFEMKNSLFATISPLLDKKQFALSVLCEKAEALSPLAVLSRGYSIAENENGVIRSAVQLQSGDVFDIRFGDGKARVKTVNVENSLGEKK